jgi:membrane protease YdiL (CAAX protease family)
VLASLLGRPEQTDVTEQLGFDESTLAAIVAGALIVAVAPFAEELFFRGFFFAGLRGRLPFPIAAVGSGILFGAVHLDGANLIAALQLTILGVILAWLYERTGSLWAPIALHAVNNSIAFSVLVTS